MVSKGRTRTELVKGCYWLRNRFQLWRMIWKTLSHFFLIKYIDNLCTKLHPFKTYNWMSYDSCIHLWNHHLNKKILNISSIPKTLPPFCKDIRRCLMENQDFHHCPTMRPRALHTVGGDQKVSCNMGLWTKHSKSGDAYSSYKINRFWRSNVCHGDYS